MWEPVPRGFLGLTQGGFSQGTGLPMTTGRGMDLSGCSGPAAVADCAQTSGTSTTDEVLGIGNKGVYQDR